jgi:hypothetical protein
MFMAAPVVGCQAAQYPSFPGMALQLQVVTLQFVPQMAATAVFQAVLASVLEPQALEIVDQFPSVLVPQQREKAGPSA